MTTKQQTLEPRSRPIDGVRIRYADSGGSHEPTLLLTSPWPAPITIINGRHDRVVPVANAEFLDVRLPNSRVMLIDAGHFVWEEAPAEYAAVIADAITGDQS